jgi:hypothetical protein
MELNLVIMIQLQWIKASLIGVSSDVVVDPAKFFIDAMVLAAFLKLMEFMFFSQSLAARMKEEEVKRIKQEEKKKIKDEKKKKEEDEKKKKDIEQQKIIEELLLELKTNKFNENKVFENENNNIDEPLMKNTNYDQNLNDKTVKTQKEEFLDEMLSVFK